jgi:hypothetical protein
MSSREMVGRVYIVRKHKDGYMLYKRASGNSRTYGRKPDGTRGWHDQSFRLSYEELGQAVMVLDERSKRVKVQAACNQTGWLPRFYLKEELKTLYSEKHGTIQEAVEALVKLSQTTTEENVTNELQKIASLLKNVQDTL